MTGFSDLMADDVAFLLQDAGSDIALTRSVSGSYDATSGTFTPATPVTAVVRAVFINYADRNIDGSVIQTGDRRLLVSATGSTTAPRIGDTVGGLQIIDVRTIAPNGIAIAWACQMRK